MLAPTKLLAVRLPEAERRRIKTLAASQGMTLQEAMHEAFNAWASQLQKKGVPPPEELATALSGADLEKPKPETGAPSRKPGRPPGAAKAT